MKPTKDEIIQAIKERGIYYKLRGVWSVTIDGKRYEAINHQANGGWVVYDNESNRID